MSVLFVFVLCLYAVRVVQMEGDVWRREQEIAALESRLDSIHRENARLDSILDYQSRYIIASRQYMVERFGETPLTDAYWRNMNAVATFRARYVSDSLLTN